MFVDFFLFHVFFFFLCFFLFDFLPGFAFGVSMDTVRFGGGLGDGVCFICFLFPFFSPTILFYLPFFPFHFAGT